MDIFTPKLLTRFYVSFRNSRSLFGPKGGIFPPMSLRGTWTSRLGSESSPAHVELKGCGKIDHFLGFFQGGSVRN